MTEPPTIARLPELISCCEAARANGAFAFDTEFTMESSYQARICLVQIAVEDRVSLVDPLAGLDLTPLWELVADPSTVCIVHAGSEDLAMAYRQLGRPPRNVFDVQIAAGFAGYEYPASLARLVQKLVGRRLHKSQTLTDWSRRPLTAAQIDYAIDDVLYLPRIHQMLTDKLDRLGRTSWAREELERFEQRAYYEVEPCDALGRLKGSGSLDRKQLAVARELLAVREKLAEQLNRPSRVIMRDHLVIEVAKHGWTSVQQLRSLRGLNLPTRVLDDIAAAVTRAQSLPSADWPALARNRQDTHEGTTLTALVTAVVRDFCDRNQIAYALVATKHQLSTLVHDFLESPKPETIHRCFSGWRGKMLGPLIEDLLMGRCAIRVKHGREGIGLQLDAHDLL